MSEIKKLVPKRRFKEFENAGSWEERKLEELGLIYTGNTPSTKDENNYFNNGMMWVTPTDIDSNIIYDTSKRLSQSGINKARIVPKGTILVTCIASIGKNALLREESGFNQQINSLTPNENNDSYFLLTQSELWSQRMRNIAASGTMQIVNKSEFSNLEFMYPNYKEQQKIGSFFQKFDDTIAFQKRKLEKMKSMKSAYLSEMFPAEGECKPKRRFPEFTGDWERRELEAEVEFYSGLTYSPSKVVKENGTLVLRSSNVKGGEIIKEDNVYVEHQVVNSDNVQVGDVIVVVRNGSRNLIGKHAQIKENMTQTVIGAFMTGVRAAPPSFLNALLDTSRFEFEIAKNLGATINQITTGAFKKMTFMFPSRDEQKKIGSFFQKFDETITLQQQKLEKLQNIKKAYLNEMFV